MHDRTLSIDGIPVPRFLYGTAWKQQETQRLTELALRQGFRSCKSLLQTRPISHKCAKTIRGHVFCSFLALVLRQEFQARLAERGHELEWADVIGDLDRLQ